MIAFSLDKLAAIREHGLKGKLTEPVLELIPVFSSSLVNGFDLVFMIIYGVYLGARTYGFHYNNADALSLGADWLAIGKSPTRKHVCDLTRARSCDDVPEIGVCDSCQ
jgi:hypothetical protein